MLKNGHGEWVEDPHVLNQLIRNHFEDVYRSCSSSGTRDFSDILACVESVVSNNINSSLESPVTNCEIHKAVKELGALGALKAPGKDGFPGPFFQRYWHIVGDSVIMAVKQFFEAGIMPPMLNKTLVVLIPKVPCPEQIGQFRPISLSFIPGRLIQDSIVIANEAFHYIRNKKKGSQQFMALKLDLSKAFDRVEWDLLLESLKRLADVLSKMINNALNNTLLLDMKMARECQLMHHVKRFFWGGDAHEKHIHRVKWERLSRPKEEGELGFRDLYAFNLALLAKQARKGSRPSWLWQSLLQGRESFSRAYDGNPFDNSSLVSDFISDGAWNMSKLKAHVSDEEANFIAEIPISCTHTNDRIIWHYDVKGNYTVKSGYRMEYKGYAKDQDLLVKIETIEHVFFECPWTKSVWFGSNYVLRADNLSGDFTSRISSLIDIFTSKSQALKLLAYIAITSWNIWKSRNKFIFKHTPLCPSQVISASNVMQSEFAYVSSLSPTPPFLLNQGAIGIIARDSEGAILAVIGERCHASSALAMELLAIRNACNLALTNGWVGAIIESDSTDTIALSSSECVPPWALGVIVADIRDWASRLNLQFSWVRCTCNRVAHHVAGIALKYVTNFSGM
ncbi:reverse transcriptase [Tanacetum coccineum]|uniref:Reverse transcriptase n=1 Tax=Tanacetum coccineum TaxID=301880 RepID=A0ABQ5ACG9_9ASTR